MACSVASDRGSSGRDRAADGGEQQRRVQARVVGGALPAPGRVQRVAAAVSATIASASATQRAACSPPRAARLIARRPAAQIRRLCVHSSGSISQMPASGSCQRCSIASRGDLGGAPAVGVEVVVAGGSGEQQQRLAEGVELELLVDPVADDRRCRRGTRAGSSVRWSGTASPVTV